MITELSAHIFGCNTKIQYLMNIMHKKKTVADEPLTATSFTQGSVPTEKLPSLQPDSKDLCHASWVSMYCRQFGVVGNLTSSLTSVAPKSFVAVPLSVVLRHTIKLNAESQLEASRKGAFKSAFVLLGQNSSLTRQTEGLKLIQDLINGNSALKDLALSRQYGESIFCYILL